MKTFLLVLAALLATACSGGSKWDCVIPAGDSPDASPQVGCWADFEALAADPLDASIPGAQSAKTVVDRSDDNLLHIQNSERYPIHWEFTFANLSGHELPIVPDLSTFNATEYTSPDRRFVLGAVTFYEGPQVWVYEIAPYDTASAEMVALAYDRIVENTYFGEELYFHPTSENVAAVVPNLPDNVRVITTDELFAGIDYQPLNLGTSMGQLQFYDDPIANPPGFREIVVLDQVPNDLSVVAGLVTGQFQTPLSHVNVLSQNRGTPNMGLRGAWDNTEFRALEGAWVELTVGAFQWSVREVTREQADAWWEAHRPDPIVVTPMDTSVTDLVDVHDLLDLDTYDLLGAIRAAVTTFGGKASHFGALSLIDGVPSPDGFVVPVHYYDAHMRNNGLWDMVDAMFADDRFHDDPVYRVGQLEALRAAIRAAPIDADLVALVSDKIRTGGYPDTRFRFRSSTNAEDVSGFNGAGLYTSTAGNPDDPDESVEDAMRKVWASMWNYRAYEERQYYSIVHTDIGMALLCHRSFPHEDANGVAITANIYDVAGLEPAFFVNVQLFDESVVLPEPGVSTDQILYYFGQAGRPIVYLQHSSLTEPGQTVLTAAQVHELGAALEKIHAYFQPAYGSEDFYGMDVEFKFDSTDTGSPLLWVKQARPYPGWGH